jgi:Short repeat of unknown function (DUF308)
MSTAFGNPLGMELRHGITALRGNWLWFVLLGVALILVGCVALGSEVIASLATAIAIGALMLISGITETIGAFWCKGWSGFFFLLLSGILSIIVGLLIPSGATRCFAGPHPAPGLFSAGGRHLPDHCGAELPFRSMGLVAGERDH